MNGADEQTASDPEAPQADRADESDAELVCDFCGEAAPRVRRVALDGEYERLRTPHAVRYACSDCSARKDGERAAGD